MASSSLRTQHEYARRVNAALDFIDKNLGDEISLARLASVAHFSPYHFHRIFAAFVGEPPAEYVRRLRLEKAAGLIAFEAYVSEPEDASKNKKMRFVFDLHVPVKAL